MEGALQRYGNQQLLSLPINTLPGFTRGRAADPEFQAIFAAGLPFPEVLVFARE